MNAISLYFALWVTIDMRTDDIFYSYTLSASMLLAALSDPINIFLVKLKELAHKLAFLEHLIGRKIAIRNR